MSRVVLTLLAFVALLLGPASVAAAAEDSAGAVYTLTNTAANAVIVYDRSASGALTWSGTFPTGGRGGSLGSQGAVVTSKDGRWLYAVDAGSNDIAVFKISEDTLVWSDRIASGGTQPVSVTTSHDLVYVVNAASHSIAGFRSNDGKLSAIAGSIQTFTGNGAAQIQFSPSGRALVVTEKTTSTLDVFVVGKDDVAGPATAYASSRATPFGFAFGRHGDLVVSEAAGAAPLSAASSYDLSKDRTLTPISRSVPTTQAAAYDMYEGRAGRMTRGDFATVEEVAPSPLEAARKLVAEGAEWLHIIDLDGSRTGKPANLDHLRAIANRFTVKIQAGGGIRDFDTAEAFAEAGASRIVVGTAAIDDPELIGRLVDRHADGLAVSVDARNGMVTTDGWTETTKVRAVDLMQRLALTGVPTVIYTNVSIDGTLQGLDLASTEAVARAFGGDIIYSGGVGSLEDIAALAKLRHRGLRGVIVGRALYLGRFTLKDALRVARDGTAR